MTARQRADLVKKQKQEAVIDVDSDLRYQDSLADPYDQETEMEEESKQ